MRYPTVQERDRIHIFHCFVFFWFVCFCFFKSMWWWELRCKAKKLSRMFFCFLNFWLVCWLGTLCLYMQNKEARCLAKQLQLLVNLSVWCLTEILKSTVFNIFGISLTAIWWSQCLMLIYWHFKPVQSICISFHFFSFRKKSMILIYCSNFMQQGKCHLLFITPPKPGESTRADNVDKACGLRSTMPEQSAIVHGCPHCLPSRNQLWVQLWL